MEKLTAAHRTLPFGTWLQVKNLSNDKTVTVRIIDRGPFVGGRILDLSHAAAVSLDMVGPGTARVKCTVAFRLVADDSPHRRPCAGSGGGQFAVQVGAFSDRRNAERVRLQMERRYGSAQIVMRDGEPAQWRVLVGLGRRRGGRRALAERITRRSKGRRHPAHLWCGSTRTRS